MQKHLGTFEAMALRTNARRERIRRENRLFYSVAFFVIAGLLWYGIGTIK